MRPWKPTCIIESNISSDKKGVPFSLAGASAPSWSVWTFAFGLVGLVGCSSTLRYDPMTSVRPKCSRAERNLSKIYGTDIHWIRLHLPHVLIVPRFSATSRSFVSRRHDIVKVDLVHCASISGFQRRLLHKCRFLGAPFDSKKCACTARWSDPFRSHVNHVGGMASVSAFFQNILYTNQCVFSLPSDFDKSNCSHPKHPHYRSPNRSHPFATFKLKLPQNHKHLPTYYSCSLSPIGCWCHHRQLWRKLSTLRPPNTSSIHIEYVNIFPGKKIAWGVHIGCNQPHKSTTGCQIKSMYIIRSEHVANVWLAEHDVCVFFLPMWSLLSKPLYISMQPVSAF